MKQTREGGAINNKYFEFGRASFKGSTQKKKLGGFATVKIIPVSFVAVP